MTLDWTQSGIYVVIAAAALLTYVTRVSGYLILSRFKALPARVEAGLDAVPAAVITTLVAPAAFSGTWREATALAITLLVGLRTGPLVTVATGTLTVIVLRAVTG